MRLKPPDPARLVLGGLRGVIDGVDDGLIALLAARRRLVRVVAAVKRDGGQQAHDAGREDYVHARGQSLAARLDVPAATARGVLEVAIGDAHRQQGAAVDAHQAHSAAISAMIAPMDPLAEVSPAPAARLLRLLPPPRRFAPLVRLVPRRALARLLETAMAHVLKESLRVGDLDFMQGRRLGIETTDLEFCFVVELQGRELRVVDAAAEASVRGSVTDLLLLASRLEDADTLFFQRRLMLTGDTELGLTARNLLDRLPWENVPLGLRIALNRGARFARVARAAHRRES
ncbi:SCP2 sterol-binding domain-containing protein [Dokdonella sp.]|uniref:ubiquinone anaerobic biosynthesis accessory factor UbiT n=1 Tax=Dokdonella sp. TaxID=2291710 RepID=UPI0025BE1B39|nr:SCP2 sterol-binding domain-containing protein [Dokdonella sp.]